MTAQDKKLLKEFTNHIKRTKEAYLYAKKIKAWWKGKNVKGFPRH